MKYEKIEMIYEGKAKKIWTTDNPDFIIVDYKDDATAFNGVKKGTITGKGVVNNTMSDLMFTMLEKKGIRTHFVE
ncbi:MAG: phosphoribosylaminoimidazolesuccinocarboxamide synthase, partial [Spirochaetaceae bacterium]|nr:phosphoribosylaminoimidazolesuccinocarboxamide synthase [Spirochaetaceae bacterium]